MPPGVRESIGRHSGPCHRSRASTPSRLRRRHTRVRRPVIDRPELDRRSSSVLIVCRRHVLSFRRHLSALNRARTSRSPDYNSRSTAVGGCHPACADSLRPRRAVLLDGQRARRTAVATRRPGPLLGAIAIERRLHRRSRSGAILSRRMKPGRTPRDAGAGPPVARRRRVWTRGRLGAGQVGDAPPGQWPRSAGQYEYRAACLGGDTPGHAIQRDGTQAPDATRAAHEQVEMFGSADENAGRIADQDLGLDGDIAAPAKLVDLKPRPNSGEGLRFTVCVNHPLDDRECAQCGSSSPRKRVTELQGRAPLLVVDVRRTDDVDRRRRLQGVWDDGDRTGRAVHQPLEHRARQRKSHCSARRRAEDEQTGVRGAGGLVKETRCVCAYQLAVVDPDVARRQLTLHIAEQVGVENEALVQGAALRQPCGLASGSGGPLGNPGAGRGVAGVVVLARPSGRASPSSSGPPHVLIADLATTRSASRGRPPGTRPSCSTRPPQHARASPRERPSDARSSSSPAPTISSPND